MSLFFAKRGLGDSPSELIPARIPPGLSANVTADTALRHSAVWACLRLRADLISTTPVDVFRDRGGIQEEIPKPPVVKAPGGPGIEIEEWLYSSQFDLDRYGNTFGLITGMNSMFLPTEIELVPVTDVTVKASGGRITGYRICGKTYDPINVWHERQFTAPGVPVGLSPIAHAAWSLSSYLSAQDFALSWFQNGAAPSGVLRNTEKTIIADVSQAAKAQFKAATANRDVFVTGKDWEFDFLSVPASETAFIETMKNGISDACRYFGVPADMIDAESSTGSITYANVTQRNLQLLIMNLNPAYVRREKAMSRWLPRPQFIKFNTDALLRMDPQAVVATLKAEIDARIRTVDEARALRNLAPLTDAQVAEFDRLFGRKDAKMPATQAASQLSVSPQIVVEQPSRSVKTIERDHQGDIVRIVES